MSQATDKMMLRLPDGMRDRVKAAAKINRRSANAEVVFHLERIFGSADAATGAKFGDRSPAAAEIETPPCKAASLVTTE